MDESAGRTHVEWRTWSEGTFEEAVTEQKPLLLALVTRWSEECHQMDATTYAEPRTAAHINDRFVPVRVDADRRPDIRERYNMGGFPSTVFLTPQGKILTGATLLGVDGFRGILESVRRAWEQKGEEAGSVPRSLREEPPRGELTHRVEEHMVEQLLATFDSEYGGWGMEVKFPLPRTVEFALVRARDQATRTLEAIQTHLLDTYDGGFYRFSRNRNWSGVRREKLADENAALVRAFAHGYRYTGDEAYRESAERGIEFLTTTLWTGQGFAASLGGDEAYFELDPTDREDADPPAVDETLLAGHNGLAIDALLQYHAYTNEDSPRHYAEQASETLVESLVDSDGCVRRYCEETNDDREAGADSPHGLLADQARVLTALTTAWSVLGEPGPAKEVADWTLENLQTEGGGFRDSPREAVGVLGGTLYPLDTAVELADALLDLALLTGDSRYHDAARDALSAFAGATERMGVEVAHYATVASRIQESQVVEVGTQPGTDLHRAALVLADHETTVAVRPADAENLTTRALPEGEARLVVDGSERGRADTPADLEGLLTNRNANN